MSRLFAVLRPVALSCLAALSLQCGGPTRSPEATPSAGVIRTELIETAPQAKNDSYKPVRKPELKLDLASREYLLRYGQTVCAKGVEAARALQGPASFTDENAPVIAVVYGEDGRRAAHHRADAPDTAITRQLETAAAEVCSAKKSGGQLHLMVVTYTGRFPNFGVKGMFDYKVFEPQVYGLAVEYAGKRVEYDPVLQTELNHGPKSMRKAINKQLGAPIDLFTNENNLIVEIYKVAHFGERRSDSAFADFHRGHTILKPEAVDKALVRQRIDLIGEWYRNNVFGGEVVYEYSTAGGKYRNEERTMVRALMATWILNRLAFFLDDQQLKDLGEEVIEHYLDTYFQIEASRVAGKIQPSGIVLPNGNTVPNRYTAGSFLGAAILERDDHARWARDDRMLMEWAMTFQRPDGILWTQFPQSQYFMPGHLMLSLAYHDEKVGDPAYKQWLDSVYDAYETPVYMMLDLADRRFHPLAPAWFTQPAAVLYHKTKDNRYRDFIYAINDHVVELHDHNRRHMVHYDYDGILTPKLGYYGNTSVTAAALESLADAAIVAKADGDMDRYKRYLTVVRHATAYLFRIQFTPDNTYYIQHRERVVGGFKSDMVNSVSWMDNVWHFTSALIKIHDHDLLADAPVAEPL
ncbi:MAG: hypothetical protein CL927_12270 [Deltaproteobacteria bacterium]|nr:hypothetical protein [Deltaproteobacteria bacterium]HCH64763.1 hypothetical protein [Deltaproteobacteria bacterium]